MNTLGTQHFLKEIFNLQVVVFVSVNKNKRAYHVVEWAAKNGNLDILKWLKRNGCPWNEDTFTAAATHGNLENMKWLKKNGCHWKENTFYGAVENGNIENMAWLKENNCPCKGTTFYLAVKGGNIETINWLKDNGCPTHTGYARLSGDRLVFR